MSRAKTSDPRGQKNVGNDVDQNKVKELAVRGTMSLDSSQRKALSDDK